MRTRTHVITLSAAQIKALAEVSETHKDEVAHVFQSPSSLITVEFRFPHRYILATNGRAIPDHA